MTHPPTLEPGATRRGVMTWCPRHWAPVRDGVLAETHNGVYASYLLFERFAKDPRIQEAMANPQHAYIQDFSRLNSLVAQHAPLCCYLGDDAMQLLLHSSLKLRAPAKMNEIQDDLRRQRLAEAAKTGAHCDRCTPCPTCGQQDHEAHGLCPQCRARAKSTTVP